MTEASLEIKSGVLRVIGCLDDTGEDFDVAPGSYRVRCCHDNLAGGNDVGDGGDWYVVQFWPAPMAEAVVLKRWEESIYENTLVTSTVK
ncbi:hypothetical protein CCAX7_60050 [Capsulimonas corticalis]|uniref:Uncharacterized protein n=1 Tax=Capsulimonas corticalis TaxID=2219043 RepID=A0A402CZJ4_9BACT|nr:hypothetical protein [Capsulimonas corticalis]BDI33954.1 hypothetical protein CCAX7_60050 [Capsulimonas corticalis]